ncbi:MAG TPA: DUF4295 family protein [Blattabacteriaceae bacterium]
MKKKKCKVIIFFKSSKTKAYSFEERILDADQVSIFLDDKKRENTK